MLVALLAVLFARQHRQPGAAEVARLTPDNAPFSYPGQDTVGAPAPVGVPLSFGSLVLANMTDWPLTISRIRVLEVDDGLEVVGVQAAVGQQRQAVAVGVLPGFPAANTGADYQEVPVIVEPERGAAPRGVDVLVGLQATRPGRLRARGIEISYVWQGREYVTTYANTLVICADTGPRCWNPQSDDEPVGG